MSEGGRLCYCMLYVSTFFLQSDSTIFVKYDTNDKIFESYNDEVSEFGPSSYEINGYLIRANPLDGCSRPDPPPTTGRMKSGDDMSPYIILMSRDNCSCDQKVFLAQQAGYRGVIVYNWNEQTQSMSGLKYESQITIPSSMVGLSAGTSLWKYGGSTSVYVTMLNMPNSLLKYLAAAMLGTIVTVFVVLLGLFSYRLISVWRQRCQSRLTRWQLRRIPQKRFVKGEDPFETCAICLDDYEDGQKIRILPCHHAFHSACIDPWLLKNQRRCPVCKRAIRFRGDSHLEDEEEAAGETGSVPPVLILSSGEDQMVDERTPLLGQSQSQSGVSGGTFDFTERDNMGLATDEVSPAASTSTNPTQRQNVAVVREPHPAGQSHPV